MKLPYLLLTGASALLIAACDPAGTNTGTDTDAATPPAEETETGEADTASAGDSEATDNL